MFNIKLPALYRGNPWVTMDEDFDEAREIRRLSGRIISAASAIDQVMAEVILDTIFCEVNNHREIVFGSVLNSDWCSFAAKRKLLKIVIDDFDLLEKGEKNFFEKNLKKVSQYRNAFAHGTLAHNGMEQELHYFEGVFKKVALNKEYFVELEGVFFSVWSLLEEMQERIIKDKKLNLSERK